MKSELKPLYDPREIQSFFYLLCNHYLGMSKTKVIVNSDQGVSESELLKFNFAIKDLKNEKPIQYILGETDFYGNSFKVNQHTLIPRPETEELVKWIADEESVNSTKKILDIGTGSGCIAISLSLLLPNTEVTAIDLSIEALNIAQLNNTNLKTKVTFEQIDILNPPSSFSKQFNLIVSNPPYVLESEKSVMRRNVIDYEPSMALFVQDTNALIFYKHILDFAKTHLTPSGKIYFEINEKMSSELSCLMQDYKYTSIQLRNDLFDRPRMISAIKS